MVTREWITGYVSQRRECHNYYFIVIIEKEQRHTKQIAILNVSTYSPTPSIRSPPKLLQHSNEESKGTITPGSPVSALPSREAKCHSKWNACFGIKQTQIQISQSAGFVIWGKLTKSHELHSFICKVSSKTQHLICTQGSMRKICAKVSIHCLTQRHQ